MDILVILVKMAKSEDLSIFSGSFYYSLTSCVPCIFIVNMQDMFEGNKIHHFFSHLNNTNTLIYVDNHGVKKCCCLRLNVHFYDNHLFGMKIIMNSFQPFTTCPMNEICCLSSFPPYYYLPFDVIFFPYKTFNKLCLVCSPER